MEKLFEGNTLLGGSLTKKGVVGLYFSAHWCPPCRGFTPKLAEIYKTLKADGKEFEIVFVSSDKDQDQFDEYFKEMPWLALPYEQRDLKTKLARKFKVNGIPMLVLLDAETGNVITADGRSALSKDPKGAKYPWIPPTVFESLGGKFVGKNVAQDPIKSKYIGIYFSAHWCGPCRNFTPKLIETYKKIRETRDDFEIIFCSADRDEKAFEEYFGTMPWLALPYDERDRADDLNALFEVEGIPSLVILGPDGKVITKSGDDAVRNDPEGKEFPWPPKPVEDLESAGGSLNQCPALVVFSDESDAAECARAAQATLDAAQAWRSGHPDSDLVFCTSSSTKGRIAEQVRRLCKVEVGAGASCAVLLDIPDGGAYYTCEGGAPDAAGLAKFLQQYESNALTRKQLE